MKVIVKKYIKTALIVLMVLMHTQGFLQAVSAGPVQDQGTAVNPVTWNPPAPAGESSTKVYNGVRGHSAPQSPDTMKILAALETRAGNSQRLLEKVGEKLAVLSEKDVRLIASLCERMPAEGRTAQSDIAFLLATALMILS